VGEGLVGVGHAVHIVLFLDGGTFIVRCEEYLIGELLGHWLSFARTSGVDEPAVRKRYAALLRNLAGDLVVGASDAAGADFHEWGDVADCSFKSLERIFLAFLDDLERVVHDLARDVLLAVPHDGIDETRNRFRVVLGIRTTWMLVLEWLAHTLCLWLLSSVSGTSAATFVDACGVELAAHDGVLNADVLHTSSAYEHNGVFLEVVTLSWDVGGYFLAIGEAHASDLTDSGVRFAGGLGGHFRADAALEGGCIESRAVLQGIEATGKSHDL